MFDVYIVSLSIPIAASHIIPIIAKYPKVCKFYLLFTIVSII